MSNDVGLSLFFCYSPAMSRFIQSKDIPVIGVGLNENTGKKFWQYARGEELDAAITEWQANNPNRRRV